VSPFPRERSEMLSAMELPIKSSGGLSNEDPCYKGEQKLWGPPKPRTLKFKCCIKLDISWD
jgi:hypothetical protein